MLYNETTDIWKLYRDFKFRPAGYSTYTMIKQVDVLFFSCYVMFFEYVEALEKYVDTLTDVDKLLYNLTHNAGNIYDLTVEAI